MARIIGEVRPSYVFVENSPMLIVRGLDRVIGDLAALGYNAKWGVVGAIDAGAPHKRERIWIVAHTNGAQTNCQRRTGELGRIAMGWDKQTPQQDVGAPGYNRAPRCRKAMAYADSVRQLQPAGREQAQRGWTSNSGADMADTNGARCEEQWGAVADGEEYEAAERGGWWAAEPGMGRMAHGVANRVDRLRCIGNGQVPAVVELAWKILTKGGE
jgi:DNA (cytosine-5)-methyltransferase 1